MELSENEKRMLYQMEGFDLEGVIRDLRAGTMYAPRPEQRKAAESVTQKLRAMPEEEGWTVGKHGRERQALKSHCPAFMRSL